MRPTSGDEEATLPFPNHELRIRFFSASADFYAFCFLLTYLLESYAFCFLLTYLLESNAELGNFLRTRLIERSRLHLSNARGFAR